MSEAELWRALYIWQMGFMEALTKSAGYFTGTQVAAIIKADTKQQMVKLGLDYLPVSKEEKGE